MNNTRILYPYNPLNKKEADEPYQDEFVLISSKGINCSLFDFDMLEFDEFKPIPRIEEGESVLYRGWMMSPDVYAKLEKYVTRRGASLITDSTNYVKCHHLSGWYDSCKQYTPETVFLNDDEQLKSKIDALGWDSFFVKDYVKSNSTEVGSIATTSDECLEIVSLIKQFRGNIEGGLAIRKVENFEPDTEERYFVFNGLVYSCSDTIPKLVTEIASIIDAPFYSVDTIRDESGACRLVELGDGQVSDKKSWPVNGFVEILIDGIK
jgi:hypothetical protein